MQISARNSLKGTVKAVEIGAVNATVTIEVAPGVEVVAMITKGSAESMSLQPGSEVYAVIKASDVMVAIN